MKVIKKQNNSKDCIICGIYNESGLKAPFYEMENGEVWSVFEFKSEHQSYPERVHGGMISAMLDELVGRAIWVTHPEMWGVTMELTVKFRKKVPYGEKLRAVGRIDSETTRTFTGTGEIYDMNGMLLASAKAVYFKLPIEKITVDESKHNDLNEFVQDNVGLLDTSPRPRDS